MVCWYKVFGSKKLKGFAVVVIPFDTPKNIKKFKESQRFYPETGI
jgi:hypothetical protein